jgi:hypothetical protein
MTPHLSKETFTEGVNENFIFLPNVKAHSQPQGAQAPPLMRTACPAGCVTEFADAPLGARRMAVECSALFGLYFILRQVA